MNRILSRSLRPAILSSRFSSSQSESVPDLSRIIEQIDPAAVPKNDAAVLINDANFFESIDTSALNGLQEFFFNSYWSIGDLAGVSPLLAIPTSILIGRLIMFPLYLQNRRTMPRYLTALMEMQYKSISLQIDMQEGKMVPPEKIKETLTNSRNKILKNFPIWGFPIGMFTTANLYAIWAIGPQAAQLNYLLPILETNIFENSILFSLLASSAQYAALKSGAEMGKITMDKSKQEKQAGDVVNKMFAVLIGISFPLQIYFNVPAYLSMMWVYNTMITFGFSKIITSKPDFFGINEIQNQNEREFYQMKMNEVMAKMNAKNEELKKNEEILKSIPNEIIEEHEAKMKKLEELQERAEQLERRRETLERNKKIAEQSRKVREELLNREKSESSENRDSEIK